MKTLVERLIATHRKLEQDLRAECARRLPDAFRVMQLKRHKLAVKDRLYQHMPEPAARLALARSAR